MADADNNITLFLRAILASVQDVENAMQQLYRERRVDTAVGIQLDVLGRLVGQKRMGLSDDDYRRYISARIATNRSNGSYEDLIKIAVLVINDDGLYAHVRQAGTATVIVRLEDLIVSLALGDIVLHFLKQAVAGGVRLVLEFSTIADEDAFIYGSTQIPVTASGKGYGSTQIAADGGGYGSAID